MVCQIRSLVRKPEQAPFPFLFYYAKSALNRTGVDGNLSTPAFHLTGSVLQRRSPGGKAACQVRWHPGAAGSSSLSQDRQKAEETILPWPFSGQTSTRLKQLLAL